MGITNFLYNPERKGKQQLIAEFVIRQPVLANIMEDLETSAMKTPEQHYLLVGQRGTGKTTLLNRIRYAIEDSPKLKSWLIPVIFSEEQYNVSDLANLWENVAQFLEDYHGFDGIYAEMEKQVSHSDFEERCRDILEAQLKKRGKKLVLLIDNIGDLLKKIGELEVRRLRMILQTKPYIRLIAGSPLYLESILDYKQPLFEFFKVIRLEGLGGKETSELLLKLGEIYNEKEKIELIIKETPGRIEALRVLTGGVPRTIALMFNIFIEHEHENSLKDLERILDLVTPLYKHKMDDLPPQQQKIVDAVAKNWDPISVKDLKDRVRLESKVISAQLRQLEKSQVVQKMETDTKNHEYILRERFFNIWYLMRYGRKDDQQRVLWLVRFLESWCTNEEIEKRIASFIKTIREKKIDENVIDFFAQVYTSLNNLRAEPKHLLGESLPQYKRNLKFSQEELNEKIQQCFDSKNYEGLVKWMSLASALTDTQKGMIVKIFSVEKYDKITEFTQFVADLFWGEQQNENFSLFQVYMILMICGAEFRIFRPSSEKEELGKNLDALKKQFQIVGSTILAFESMGYFMSYEFEMPLLLIGVKELYSKGLINSIRKIFHESFVEYENKRVKFSEIFNPIYLALNSLGSEGKTINLTPEKEGIVHEIKDFITAK